MDRTSDRATRIFSALADRSALADQTFPHMRTDVPSGPILVATVPIDEIEAGEQDHAF